jgi:glycoside/pentoside/hexuronide:cation symporter, GPH family
METAKNIESSTQVAKTQTKGIREIPRKRLIGDGVGMLGLNIFSGLSMVLLYFYTDVAGIAAGLAGTLIMVSRVFDGFTDLFMGSLVDRTQSKYGKARPWLLWLAIPTAIVSILLFYIPDIGATGKIIYILITNILFFSVGLTGLLVAFASLMALTTRNPYDRSLMGIFRGIFGLLGGMIMSIAFIPIVNSMGNDQSAWLTLVMIVASVAGLAVLIAFKSSREQISSKEKVEKEKQVPFKHKIKALFSNKYLMMLLGVQILVSTAGVLNGAAGIYYAQYIWGNVSLVGVIGAAGFLPMVVGFIILSPFVKRFGKRNVFIGGSIVTIIGCLIRLIDVYSFPIGIAGVIIAGLGMVPTLTLLGPMVSDTIEYGEWKKGLRMEGLVNGGISFTSKLGNGIATAAVGWLLALGGYVAGAATQSELTIQMILATNIYIPLLISVLVVVLLKFYKLDQEYAQIVSDLESR